MRRGRCLTTLLAAGAISLGGATDAMAADWFASTTGASGSGTWTRTRMVYQFNYTIRDTAADSSCAYLRLRPKVRNSYTGLWLSAGNTGTEAIRRVCGQGATQPGIVWIDVAAAMNSVDRATSDKYKLEYAMCRDVNNRPDNCDVRSTPAIDF